MSVMLAQIIQSIKDITGARFYFISTLLFICFVAVLFKDEIKQFDFNPKELRQISNEKGLISKLQELGQDHTCINGYVLYLYQPKVDSYYKKLVSSDIPYVNDNQYFKAMPLNAQKYLNYLLIEREYILVSSTDSVKEAEIAQQYNSEYVYIYNIYMKETIGEVILTFKTKPTEAELAKITKELRNVKYFIV